MRMHRPCAHLPAEGAGEFEVVVLPRLSRQDIVQIALAILAAFIPFLVFYFLLIG
jgi:hypothetical protein